MIANTPMTRSRVTSSGKNILQYESFAPLGRPSYFMSVMYAEPVVNGRIQNDVSRPAGMSVVRQYFSRLRSIHTSAINTTAMTTKIATMPSC